MIRHWCLQAAQALEAGRPLSVESCLANAAFAKLDVNLSSHNLLSLRLNTSRYSGRKCLSGSIEPDHHLRYLGQWNRKCRDGNTDRISHQRAFGDWSVTFGAISRDLQWSENNSNEPLTRIPGIIDGMGRSTILPRQTREHRLHFAETISREGNGIRGNLAETRCSRTFTTSSRRSLGANSFSVRST